MSNEKNIMNVISEFKLGTKKSIRKRAKFLKIKVLFN